ncbi:MAG TPA: helix-turn-helix domain-containing protein [Candidatus Binatia bacterium]|nr:helix-turn-helix domain-containing protein [Candidatus Binatia bacterium]
MRRWRRRYEERGYDGLWDRRHQSPSPRRVPMAEAQRILRLYRERYLGFNVRHFYEIAAREHGVELSYSFVKAALQQAGLVRKKRARGKHRKRREPRASYGEMLHIDGSKHAWLSLVPEEQQT